LPLNKLLKASERQLSAEHSLVCKGGRHQMATISSSVLTCSR